MGWCSGRYWRKKYKKMKSKYKEQRADAREYKRYVSKYERAQSKYDQYKEKYETYRGKYEDEKSAFREGQRDWDSQLATIQQAHSQAVSDRERDLLAERAGIVSGYESQIGQFNAAQAAREQQARIAADYGSLQGQVGSVATNLQGQRGYNQRFFSRGPDTQWTPPPGFGQIDPNSMIIQDQAINV